MNKCLKSLAGCILFAAAALAQAPSIGGLANNYSYIAAGLPNYGIAQGSIFDIFGTNLVSANVALQNVPLKSTINGVTVNVTVNGTTTHPLLYSLYHGSPDEIAAVLPSATPVGTGTITVTTSAGTSASFPIVVVQSGFGILALNGYGSGLGAIQDANNGYSLLGLTGSAKPGDALVLWGTGLGPVTGDESQAQQQVDFGSNFPIEVDVGGVSAAIAYHGRSVFPGLDEVIFTVPPGVSGCSVSIVVLSKNNKIVSNVVTAPMAASGGTCSDASTGYTSTLLQKCATTGCSTGGISVTKTTTTTTPITVQGITVGGGTTTTDDLLANFSKITVSQAAYGIYGLQTVSMGSCSVYTLSYSGMTPPSIPTGTYTALNAGTINATTPVTTATMAFKNGGYDASGNGGTLIPVSSGGNFSFNNGSGGPDVGAFTTQISLGPPLNSNLSSLTTVNRSAGATVTWTGGTPGTYVTISGESIGSVGTGGTSFVVALFWCNAPQSQGSFAIPATVLLALPATGSLTESGVTIPLPSTLSVSNSANPVTFTANNIDLGILTGEYTTSQQVTYQ